MGCKKGQTDLLHILARTGTRTEGRPGWVIGGRLALTKLQFLLVCVGAGFVAGWIGLAGSTCWLA